jgi:outer membrane protein assembly factor BamB
MFGFDAQQTHTNPYEQVLNPTTVSGLTKQWAYQTGGSIDSSPAVVGSVVYVGSADGTLYAFDAASGTRKWAYHTEKDISGSPAVANGVVYISSADGNLYALDAASGTRKWAYQIATRDATFITSSPAVANGVVYVGSWDHNLYAFHPSGA